MESTREELQKALATIGARGRGKPYPKGLLEQLVAYTVARRRQGAALLTIGDELGISWKTLARWLSERTGTRRFKRVQVIAPSRRDVIVHGPRGLRMEGLSIEDVAELVRRLGE